MSGFIDLEIWEEEDYGCFELHYYIKYLLKMDLF